MQLEVHPKDTLIDDEVSIKVTGLSASMALTLTANVIDANGQRWESSTVYRSEAEGVVDLTQQAPISGAYRTVDPMGLFWSMRPTDPKGVATKFLAPWNQLEIALTACAKGHEPQSVILVRRLSAPGVTRTDVRKDRLTAVLFESSGSGPHPGVVLYHGSGGGIRGLEPVGALLASRGYSALVVGYFGVTGLPETLCEVPLEVLAAGVRWLQLHPNVDATRVGALGTSVGAEGVLTMAAFMDDLNLCAVTAMSPSSVVWQALTEGRPPMRSRWTQENQSLSYVPLQWEKLIGQVIVNRFRKMFRRLAALRTRPAYEAGLSNVGAVARAFIPVERIKAPLLLIAGEDDPVWPSRRMAETLLKRRSAADLFQHDRFVTYAQAGHMTLHVPNIPTTLRVGGAGFLDFGGTAEGDAAAMADSWSRIKTFLEESLI